MKPNLAKDFEVRPYDVRRHDEDRGWTWGAGAAVVVILAGLLKVALVEIFARRRGESEREPRDDK